MKIEDEILINQLAQGVKPMSLGEEWFMRQDEASRLTVLRSTSAMAMQASPIPADVKEAISRSGLKETATQCVLVQKPNLKVQLAKIVNLKGAEQKTSFRLLVSLLGVADERRRKTKPLDLVNHWWHRDLSDERVIAQLLAR